MSHHSYSALSHSGSHRHYTSSHDHSQYQSPRYIHTYDNSGNCAATTFPENVASTPWAAWHQIGDARTGNHGRSNNSRNHSDGHHRPPALATPYDRYRICKSTSTPYSRNGHELTSGHHSQNSYLPSQRVHTAAVAVAYQCHSSSSSSSSDEDHYDDWEKEDDRELLNQSPVFSQPHHSHDNSDGECISDFHYPVPSPFPGSPSWSVSTARNFKQGNLEQTWYEGRAMVQTRTSDRIHDRLHLHPGVIFSTAHHTANYESNFLRPDATIAYDDPHRTSTAFGVVFSKYRKFVVLRSFGLGVLCLPIYSHNGTGLAHKLNGEEYMAIRDSRDSRDRESVDSGAESTSESQFDPESGRECVVAHMNQLHDGSPRSVLSAESAIFLAEPVLFRFNTHLTIEGCLPVDDVSRLQALFRSFF
ncbi:hypothetical protein CMQ_6163 [Grosmannia clavigera kw1407]|uniref:DUF6590 domain-containing protein n=1 Tax=Grosmannia clavigera (strain kw1407 / UAMH 11150) TaxID=655863 RepID=F0XMJ3_GROCL|nr:uncharacterized protein CMQ_6163 [Grosmannia clavigera kw1407]EFX01221.1 hypothetical protein CMQ_6163 [Grosmannia clavigera kw1407]